MAVYREDIIDIDLETGTIHRNFTNKMIGEGDVEGNRFGVRVLRNGQEVDLTGVTVIGFFITQDGRTIVINAPELTGKSGSRCWVTLPEACYTYTGGFTLAIKLTGGDITTTARIVDGTVVDTVIGDIVDPGGVIPSYEEYAELVEAAEAAAEKVESFNITETLISGTRYRIGVVDAT